MAEEPEVTESCPSFIRKKLLFYLTGFFLLVAIFSLFFFLFLVPFVIEPAYTTLKMDFDTEPAICVTVAVQSKRGLSNCSWTSCKEGCTKEVYECTQIIVDYKHPNIPTPHLENTNVEDQSSSSAFDFGDEAESFDQSDTYDFNSDDKRYKWYFGAKLFPNVKGCGYPPFLNCTVFNETYVKVGTNFSCYYSRADPSLVVSHLDMNQVRFNLIAGFVLPVGSFIISVIYLTFAYFYIYNNMKTKDHIPFKRKNTATNRSSSIIPITPAPLSTPNAPLTSGMITPVSDIFCDDVNSFGHQYHYAMADDMLSRESLDSLAFNYSSSMNGLVGLTI